MIGMLDPPFPQLTDTGLDPRSRRRRYCMTSNSNLQPRDTSIVPVSSWVVALGPVSFVQKT